MRRQIFLPLIHDHPYFCFPEAVGWYHSDAHHQVDRTQKELNCFNLHIVLSGKGYLKAEQQTYVLQQGDAFLYFPSDAQTYYSDKDHPWEVMWLHFNGHFLRDYLMEKGFHLSHVWTLKLCENVKGALENLLIEAETNAILHQSTLSTLTYGVLSEFIAQAEPLNPNKGALYQRVIDLLPKMREQSVKPFQLDYWAAELQISTYYFCRIFKKATGMSPTNFVTLCRLQKSKQLLIEQQNWTVKQVALESGYPNISYFGKIFLENEGITPLGYRNRHM